MYDHYEALIFDMDGTLVDSGQLHENAWALTLHQYGIPVDRPLMRSLAGVSTKATVTLLCEKFTIRHGIDLQEINDFKERVVRDTMQQFVKPTGLIDIVKQYHGKKPMAIGTGAYTDEARLILKLCGLDQFMLHVVGADQVQNPKPAPDTFLRCASLLGVAAAHCVVFEDSQLGLQAAASAGMTGVDVFDVHNVTNNYFI